MNNPWLIVDVSGLAHRALHTTGGLSHQGVETGVAFGVFRDVLGLMEDFGTQRVAWCFDRGYDCRTNIYPDYKRSRTEKTYTEDEREAFRGLREQVYRMRTRWLWEVGFNNVFMADGYEADDVIASVCLRSLNFDDSAVIVSSDHDLWQLLRPNVAVWSPSRKRAVTEQSFREEWGVEPCDWPKVLAIAGCDGDGVPGIAGVGEKTAIQWLKGSLKPTGKKWAAIRDGRRTIERNDMLVRLPFPGVGEFPLVEDGPLEWGTLLERLGMRSLESGFTRAKGE